MEDDESRVVDGPPKFPAAVVILPEELTNMVLDVEVEKDIEVNEDVGVVVLEAPEGRSVVDMEVNGETEEVTDEATLPEVFIDEMVDPEGEMGLGPLPLVQSSHGRPPARPSVLVLPRNGFKLTRARGVRCTS